MTEWSAYEMEYGPLGHERGDWQAGLVAYTVAAMLGSGTGPTPKLNDFLLRWAQPKRQTPEEMLAIFRSMASEPKD